VPHRHCVVVFAAFLAAWLASAAHAGEALRWKFGAGDSFSYGLRQHSRSDTNANGVEFTVDIDLLLDTRWTVRDAADSGLAELEVAIDRVRLEIRGPQQDTLLGDFSYDSRSGRQGEGELWSQVKELLEAMPGATYALRAAPTGELSDIVIPEAVAAALAALPPARGPYTAGPLFSEDGQRQLLAMCIAHLPASPVEPGATWQQRLERRFPLGGKLVTDVAYTFTGPEQIREQALAALELRPHIVLEFDPNAAFQLNLAITEQSGEGTAKFDPAAGRTVQAHLQTRTLVDGEVASASFTQDVQATIDVWLGGCPETTGEAAP
jgi:hypothetical protein